MHWLILFFGVMSNALASVMVKYGVTKVSSTNSIQVFGAVNSYLIIGVILYALAFVLYAFSLAKLPLGIVHPILTGGSIALVFLSSNLLFREDITYLSVGGILLIVIGIIILTFNKS